MRLQPPELHPPLLLQPLGLPPLSVLHPEQPMILVFQAGDGAKQCNRGYWARKRPVNEGGRMWEIILDAVDCQSLQCLLTVRVQDRNTALLSHGGLGRHQKYDFVPNDVVDLQGQGVEQHLGVGIALDVINGLVHFLG